MTATVYLKPCPICTPGKRCQGHVDPHVLMRPLFGAGAVGVLVASPKGQT